MGKPQPDKRTRLIETAMKLAHRNGFRETSLADIAEAAHVPGGDGPVEFSEGAAVCFCGKRSWEPGAACAWGMSAGRLVFRVAQGGRRSRKEIRGALHRANGLARGAIPGGRP